MCECVCVLGVISILVMAAFPALGYKGGRHRDQTPDRWHWSIRQVICLRLMWPLDGQPEEELQDGSVGDCQSRPSGGIRSSWSWINFTDWIRNLQLFEMNSCKLVQEIHSKWIKHISNCRTYCTCQNNLNQLQENGNDPVFPLLSSAFINEEADCFFSSESLWQVREPTWFIKMIMLTRSQLFFKAEQHLDFTASLKLTSQPVTVQAKKFIFCFFLAKSTPTNKVLSTAMKRWEKIFPKHFKKQPWQLRCLFYHRLLWIMRSIMSIVDQFLPKNST